MYYYSGCTNHVAELIKRIGHTGDVSPTTVIDETHMRVLERAIEGFEEVKFKYCAQKAKSAVLRQVRPLRLLSGCFAYLVASTGNHAPISYRLDLLENEELAGEYFEPKRVGISKNRLMKVLAFLMAIRYGMSKSDFQKTLLRELKKSTFIYRRKSVMAGMAHW